MLAMRWSQLRNQQVQKILRILKTDSSRLSETTSFVCTGMGGTMAGIKGQLGAGGGRGSLFHPFVQGRGKGRALERRRHQEMMGVRKQEVMCKIWSSCTLGTGLQPPSCYC